MTRLTSIFAAALLSAVATSGAALAGTLENLERERAIALGTLLSADLEPTERQSQTSFDTESSGEHTAGSLSSNGRYLAFESAAQTKHEYVNGRVSDQR